MENIYLIGYMGSGKSTVGAELKNLYKEATLVEMDECIEKEQGKTINEIFAEKGEEYFRSVESRLLTDISKKVNQIVSTGGGVVLSEENVKLMQSTGVVIWLEISPEECFNRINQSTTRPLLKDNMSISYIQEMMDKRNPLYKAAQDFTIQVDGKTTEIIVESIKNFRKLKTFK